MGSHIGELVINEQDPQFLPPARGLKGFVVRHWIGLLVALIIVLLLVTFVIYLRHKQPLEAA